MATLMLANPRRRKAKSHKKIAKNPRRKASIATRVSKLSPFKRRSKSRSKSVGVTTGNAVTMLKHGAIAGVGAVAAEIAASYLPIPLSLKTGPMKDVASALIGVGVGIAVSKFANKEMGKAIALGAVTVATANATRNLLKGHVPGLSGYDDYGLLGGMDDGLLGVGAYDNGDSGDYSDDGGDIGYYQNPAQIM